MRNQQNTHHTSSKPHMEWATDTLSKAFDFNVRSLVKRTTAPYEWRHLYHPLQTIQTFGLDKDNITKLAGLGFGGAGGICGMVLIDEVVDTKPMSDLESEEKRKLLLTVFDTVFRVSEETEPWKIDWQMATITYNPWTPKNHIAEHYIKPFIVENEEILKKWGKQKYIDFNYASTGISVFLNNFLVNEFLAKKKAKAKWANIISTNPKTRREARTIDLGLTGYIEGAIYEEALASATIIRNTKDFYPNPIALTFGIDFGYIKDLVVMKTIGYSANYSKEIWYDEVGYDPKSPLIQGKKYRNSYIARKLFAKIIQTLIDFDMPNSISYTATIDGHAFSFWETMKKAREEFWLANPFIKHFNIRLNLSTKPKIVEQINDERNLFLCDKIVIDEFKCGKSLQEYSNLQWKNDSRTTKGDDHFINATWYGREPYKAKIMKGVIKW